MQGELQASLDAEKGQRWICSECGHRAQRRNGLTGGKDRQEKGNSVVVWQGRPAIALKVEEWQDTMYDDLGDVLRYCANDLRRAGQPAKALSTCPAFLRILSFQRHLQIDASLLAVLELESIRLSYLL